MKELFSVKEEEGRDPCLNIFSAAEPGDMKVLTPTATEVQLQEEDTTALQ